MIRPGTRFGRADLMEIVREHELLSFLVWRDMKVRYKQTALGVLWIALQPPLTTVVLTVLFGRFAQLPTDGVPYPVYVCSGLVLWQLFAQGLTRSVSSLVADSSLVSKIYFPRLLLPLGTILGSLVDFAIALLTLAPLLVFYRITPTPSALLVPVFVILTAATALTLALWLGPLNARYRDVSYTLPFLLQIGMLVSPVAYSVRMIPAEWRSVYLLNPMAGVIDGFRWALLGTPSPEPLALAGSLITLIVAAAAGLVYFTSAERTFADVI